MSVPTRCSVVLAAMYCSALLGAGCGGTPAASPAPSTTPPATASSAGGEPGAVTTTSGGAGSAAAATTSAESAPPATTATPAATSTPGASEPAAPATTATASSGASTGAPAPDDNAGHEPGACTGLFDPDRGVTPPARNALASYYLIGGFGNDARFEVLPGERITYVVRDGREGTARCFRGPVTAAALTDFRAALARAGACRLPHDASRPIPDRGPLTFAFRLPGLACQPRISGRGLREADMNRLEAVYTAFDALGAPVCGAHCRRGSP